jgi:hypothetical protein
MMRRRDALLLPAMLLPARVMAQESPTIHVIGPANDGMKPVVYGIRSGLFGRYGLTVEFSWVSVRIRGKARHDLSKPAHEIGVLVCPVAAGNQATVHKCRRNCTQRVSKRLRLSRSNRNVEQRLVDKTNSARAAAERNISDVARPAQHSDQTRDRDRGTRTFATRWKPCASAMPSESRNTGTSDPL